ncbi:terminase small subunit [Hymenobacter sp. GOD-10R]|uniref:terminase small subunit n=1 Tax=Hymenobacter sp. GOD-10R TaxID=3093922 RepID=UPI002D791254|nr:terminase small subunit [Hymenobacter sp. GOD-10R]WRQ27082.1 terminase small subunit [Hymenobacter sp. GOD-10R]
MLAGYATSGAGQEGHRLLKNAEIRAAVDERMSTLAMSAEEVVQRMSEAASILLNEHFTIKKAQDYEQEHVTIGELAQRKEGEIDFIREFLARTYPRYKCATGH